MALQRFGRIFLPDPKALIGATSFTSSGTMQIAGAGQRVGWVFPVPEACTIDRVGVRLNAVATPATCRLGLYTVDGDGNPTSTPYGGSAYGTFAAATAAQYTEVTLPTPATATPPDKAALVLEFDDAAGSVNLTAISGAFVLSGMPYFAKHDGTSWAKETGGRRLVGHVRTSDGLWLPIDALPLTGLIASNTITSATTPDEVALAFTLPIKAQCIGLWHAYQFGTAGDNSSQLLQGATELAAATADGDHSITGANVKVRYWPTPVTLQAGVDYRATLRMTAAVSSTYRTAGLFAAGAAEAMDAIQALHLSTRADAGAWTDTTNSLPLMGVILRQIDDGAPTAGAAGVNLNTLVRV